MIFMPVKTACKLLTTAICQPFTLMHAYRNTLTQLCFFSKIWNARLDELWHLSLCPRYHRSCSAMPNHERCHFCVCVHICTSSLPPFETNPPNVKADVGWQLHSSAEGSNSIMDAVSNVGVWVDKIYMGEKRRREGEEVGGGWWYHWNTAGVTERGMGGMISYRRQGGCFRVSVFSCWWPACPSIYFLHKLSVITPTAQHDTHVKKTQKQHQLWASSSPASSSCHAVTSATLPHRSKVTDKIHPMTAAGDTHTWFT